MHKAFSEQNLNGPWANFSQHLDQHTINYLSHASDILNAYSNELDWDLEELSDISNSLSDLIKEINSGEFSGHVRAYMTAKIREIQIAIEEYDITGGGPISEAVDSAFGRLNFDSELLSAPQHSDSAKNFWKLMQRLLIVT